jgi:hypothetical protein
MQITENFISPLKTKKMKTQTEFMALPRLEQLRKIYDYCIELCRWHDAKIESAKGKMICRTALATLYDVVGLNDTVIYIAVLRNDVAEIDRAIKMLEAEQKAAAV